jgi:DeoR/GlpR family transcriptional regulator of sugar metabolism
MARQGKRWALTDKRKKYVLKQLELQMSVSAIALELDVEDETLHRKLKEEGIDHRAVRTAGIAKLRKNCLQRIYNIADDKDMATTALRYLAKYDDSVLNDNKSTNVTVSVSDAAQQVLEDLS